MRIWDISPKNLCRQHLLGEHRELHAIWSVLINGKNGYRNHPETKRWLGKNLALYLRHERLIREIKRRGYNHCSPLDKRQASGRPRQSKFINTKAEQKIMLKNKGCGCFCEL